jgi:hypothetical protein
VREVSAVHRFHQALVNEIRTQRPEYLSGMFTVAEIYQALVPYRTHRGLVGVELNGDYEDALLRLLAGEGDLLLLESEPARLRILDELKRADPNTGIYREFAALGVRLNPKHTPPAAQGSAPPSRLEGGKAPAVSAEPALDLLGAVSDSAGTAPPASHASKSETHPETLPTSPAVPASAPSTEPVKGSAPSAPSTPASLAPKGGTAAPAASSTSATPASAGPGASQTPAQQPPHACPECTRDLPPRDGLRFCPFCGVDVHVRSCAGCGESLERAWSFCVSCGLNQMSGVPR